MEARLDDYTKYHYRACPYCGKPIRPKAGEVIYRDPDLILDNMAGSGTTMLACTLGRNVILVELEEKFCKMMRDNWELVRLRPESGYSMGECQIIQGDARQLEGLLVDKCIFSPPFGDSEHNYRHGLKTLGKNFKGRKAWENKGQVDKIVTSPPYAETGVGDWQTPRKEFQEWVKRELETKGYIEWQGKRYTEHQWRDMNYGRLDGRTTKGVHKQPTNGYGKSDGQIGNLPYGQIDKIVTSPPYAESVSAHAGGERDQSSARQREKRLRDKGYDPAKYQGGVGRNLEVDFQYSKDPDNLGNLPYGNIDSIITSPPYEEAMGNKHHSPRADKLAQEKRNPTTYTDRVDSIITSPPYEGTKQDDKRANDPEQIDKRAREFEKAGGDFHTPGRLRSIERHYAGYASSGDNIGNLKGDTYLEAMLQVYQQCYQVLKPNGLLIVVVKPFIRDKKVVPLQEDTKLLCQRVGFSFIEEHHRILRARSFWRIIYQKKYPEVPPIDREYILVFNRGLTK